MPGIVFAKEEFFSKKTYHRKPSEAPGVGRSGTSEVQRQGFKKKCSVSYETEPILVGVDCFVPRNGVFLSWFKKSK